MKAKFKDLQFFIIVFSLLVLIAFIIVSIFSDINCGAEQLKTQTGIGNKIIYQSIIGIIVIGAFIYYIRKRVIIPLQNIEEFSKALKNNKYDVEAPKAYFTTLQNIINTLDNLREEIEEKHQQLDNLPTPVFEIDRDFNIKFINKMGAKIAGADQESLIGKKCYDQFNTEHCKTDKCATARAMKTNSIVIEETVARPKTGDELSVMYTGAPVKDRSGKVVAGLASLVDITDTKEMERYLNRSTATLMKAIEKFASGDLTVSVKSEKTGDDIAKLFTVFNESVIKVRELMKHIADAVDATASASTQISSSAEEMAAGAQEQSAQTSEVSAAVEEMAATIVSSAQNASEAADLAKLSEKTAGEGGEIIKVAINEIANIADVVREATKTVENLGASSERIGEIIQVINDIADQTNLLALNAAIEAARAGEHGRGFAVVADEVRKLAERTTTATKEIAEMIKQIQTQTDEAVTAMHAGQQETEEGKKLMGEAGKSLEDIIKASDKVLGAIEQVATASEEESATIEEISKNMEGINLVAQESAAGVEQIAKASEDLNQLTENLQRLIQEFHLEDTGNSHLIENGRNSSDGYYLNS